MSQRGKRRGGFPSDQDLVVAGLLPALERRIGRTERELLAWAVRAVQRNPKDMTLGDWDNLRSEVAVFCLWPWRGTTMGEITEFAQVDPMNQAGEIIRPTQIEAGHMRMRMKAMIEDAVKRKPVTVDTVEGTLMLLWSSVAAGSRWYRSWYGVQFSWPDRVAHALAELIHKEGALLKECPAPAKRAKAGEICGEWFVAKRPNQDYCSPMCQSRASTRAKRAGTATPAAQGKAGKRVSRGSSQDKRKVGL